MAIKIMLVDDEPGVRLLLRKIIERQKAFEIVGECESMTDAVMLFNRTKPDVVFLDIEIGGASGIECAKIIADMAPKTKIIFATAHAEYMPEAFSVYAFDYLVKPFNVDRVKQTLERICGMLQLAKEKEEIRRESGLDRLLIKGKESACFVDTAEIILVQREEGSTVLYTQNDSFTTSASLNEIEAKLNPDLFMRSHKSYLINVSQIKRIEPYGRWTYIVTFKNLDKDALITAEKYEELKRRYY